MASNGSSSVVCGAKPILSMSDLSDISDVFDSSVSGDESIFNTSEASDAIYVPTDSCTLSDSDIFDDDTFDDELENVLESTSTLWDNSLEAHLPNALEMGDSVEEPYAFHLCNDNFDDMEPHAFDIPELPDLSEHLTMDIPDDIFSTFQQHSDLIDVVGDIPLADDVSQCSFKDITPHADDIPYDDVDVTPHVNDIPYISNEPGPLQIIDILDIPDQF